METARITGFGSHSEAQDAVEWLNSTFGPCAAIGGQTAHFAAAAPAGEALEQQDERDRAALAMVGFPTDPVDARFAERQRQAQLSESDRLDEAAARSILGVTS